MASNNNIKQLSLVLTILHVLGTCFAIVVLALAAAALAEANQAAAAVSSSLGSLSSQTTDLTGALSSLQASFDFSGLRRRTLLALGSFGAAAFMMVSFTAFLGFTLFVSASGLLWSAFFAICSQFKPTWYDKTFGALASKSPAWAKRPFYELLIACVWSILWLAAAAVASDSPLARISGYCTGVSSCDRVNALVALSWLSWLIWLTVVVLHAVDLGLTARAARKTHAAAAGQGGAAAATGGAKAKTEGKEGKEAAPAPAGTKTAATAVAPAPAAAVIEVAAAPAPAPEPAAADKPKEGDVEMQA